MTARETFPPVAVAHDADAILATADRVGRDVLAPHAQITDLGAEPPRENFEALRRAGLLGLTVPVQYGGLGADSILTLQVMETLARYCATTAFLLTQHTGVCSSIAAGGSPLASDLLPALAHGGMLAGIGASQLRRAGAPMLRAVRVERGYSISGTVPWASGFGLMTHIALGTAVEDVGPLFFWVPFRPAEHIHIGDPQDLAVMRATFTVSLTCDGLFVPDDAVIGDDRGGYWRAQHGGTLTNPVAFLLGIGTACLEGMTAAVERSRSSLQREHLAGLFHDLAVRRDRYYALLTRLYAGDRGDAVLDALVESRVSITSLVLRLAEKAIAAEGGSAHLRTNPAQRRLREASFFLTATINASMREALVLGL